MKVIKTIAIKAETLDALHYLQRWASLSLLDHRINLNDIIELLLTNIINNFPKTTQALKDIAFNDKDKIDKLLAIINSSERE